MEKFAMRSCINQIAPHRRTKLRQKIFFLLFQFFDPTGWREAGACLFDGKLSLHRMIKLAGAMSAIGP
jgi:hypothetical protein